MRLPWACLVVVLCGALAAATGAAQAPSSALAVEVQEVSGDGVAWRVGSLLLVGQEEQSEVLESLAHEVAPRYARMTRSLGLAPRGDFVLHVVSRGVRPPEPVRQLEALAPEWAAGYLFAPARVGAVRLALAERYPYQSAVSVVLHETVHQILHDAVGDGVLPLWFEEGVATSLGQRWGLREQLLSGSTVAWHGVPRLAEIDRGFRQSTTRARISYSAAYRFLAWSERRFGADLVPRLLAETDTSDFKKAWASVTGELLAGSERRWRRGGLLLYRVLPLLGSSGALWIAMSALAVLGGAKRRTQFRARMERWRRREEEIDLEVAERVEPLTADAPEAEPPADGERPAPGSSLAARERARRRWGLPSGDDDRRQHEGPRPPRRRSDEGEWIN